MEKDLAFRPLELEKVMRGVIRVLLELGEMNGSFVGDAIEEKAAAVAAIAKRIFLGVIGLPLGVPYGTKRSLGAL